MIPPFANKLFQYKLFRFVIVSGINTLFGYGLFTLLIFAGLSYKLALLIGTIAGILFNFKTTGLLVFKNGNNILIFKFFGVYGITYLCNLGGLAVFESFEVNIYLSGAILLLPMGILAFLLYRTLVFKDSQLIKE